jgi:hypothetical protein
VRRDIGRRNQSIVQPPGFDPVHWACERLEVQPSTIGTHFHLVRVQQQTVSPSTTIGLVPVVDLS